MIKLTILLLAVSILFFLLGRKYGITKSTNLFIDFFFWLNARNEWPEDYDEFAKMYDDFMKERL